MFPPFCEKPPRRKAYIREQFRHVLVALLFIATSLAVGTVGYMWSAHLDVTDAFLNASMILGGMGPINTLPNAASKRFASFYALYGGVALLSIVAARLAPTIHRLMHVLHLDQKGKAPSERSLPRLVPSAVDRRYRRPVRRDLAQGFTGFQGGVQFLGKSLV